MGLPAALTVPLLIGSTALSAVGAISQGNQLAAMANYQSQVAANNAKIAGQYAALATQTGEAQVYQEGLKQRQEQQAITAGIASGGINVNTGSAADVRESGRELGMLDVETVRQQAAIQAYGYKTEQTGFQAESQLQSAAAGFDVTAGWLHGVGSLLSGGAALGFLPGGTSPIGGAGTTPMVGGVPYGLTGPVWSGTATPAPF